MPDSPTSDERPSPEVSRIAAQAVDRLGIRQFIDDYAVPIYKKLLDCERQANDAPKINSDMLFVAAALPVINGVIQIASDRTTTRRAIAWLRDQPWIQENTADEKDFDPLSVLSALTLIEVVNQAWRESHKTGGRNAEHVKEWDSIIKRMRKFSEEIDKEDDQGTTDGVSS